MHLVRPEFKLVGIISGSWYHCLPIRIIDYAAVVCEAICCMEV